MRVATGALLALLIFGAGGCEPRNPSVAPLPPSPSAAQPSGAVRRTLASLNHWKPESFFKDTDGLTLSQAISQHDLEGLTALADAGADLQVSGKFGMTLLHWALFEENWGAFDFLLQRGVSPDQPLHDEFEEAYLYVHLRPSESVLFTSLRYERERYFNKAFEYTRDPLQRTSDGHNLMNAYFWKEVKTASTFDALLEAGVDVSNQSFFGDAPILQAMARGKPDMCLKLLQAGADPTVKNAEGQDVRDYIEERQAWLTKWGRSDAKLAELDKWLREHGHGSRAAADKRETGGSS